MLAQGMASVYSMVTTSWMFIYFRDSFITLYENFKWTKCEKNNHEYSVLRNCPGVSLSQHNFNQSWKIEESIPDYFSATVLQRSSPVMKPGNSGGFENLKFQVVFNLIVIWMIVFICLSKGM